MLLNNRVKVGCKRNPRETYLQRVGVPVVAVAEVLQQSE